MTLHRFIASSRWTGACQRQEYGLTHKASVPNTYTSSLKTEANYTSRSGNFELGDTSFELYSNITSNVSLDSFLDMGGLPELGSTQTSAVRLSSEGGEETSAPILSIGHGSSIDIAYSTEGETKVASTGSEGRVIQASRKRRDAGQKIGSIHQKRKTVIRRTEPKYRKVSVPSQLREDLRSLTN
jgi:hypothetical protein